MNERLKPRIKELMDTAAHVEARVVDPLAIQLRRSWLSLSRHKRILYAAGAATGILAVACSSSPSTPTVKPDKIPILNHQTVNNQPDITPIANSQIVIAQALPTEFYWPFLGLQYFSGAPHDSFLKDGIRDAIDIAPSGAFGCPPGQRKVAEQPVLATASGTIKTMGDQADRSKPNHSIMEIETADYIVGMEHLDQMLGSVGQEVIGGRTIIAKASCETPPGGKTTGIHVHLYIRDKNGKQIPIANHNISGWLIIAGSTPYNGTLTKAGEETRTANVERCGPSKESITSDKCNGTRDDLLYIPTSSLISKPGPVPALQPTPTPIKSQPTPAHRIPPTPIRQEPTPTRIPSTPTIRAVTPTSTPIPSRERFTLPGFTRYNGRGPFQMDIPSNWSFLRGGSSNGKTMEWIGTDPSPYAIAPRLLVMIERLTPGTTLNSYENLLLTQLKSDLPLFGAPPVKVTFVPRLIDGQDGYTFELYSLSPPVNYEINAVTIDQGLGVVLTLTDLQESFLKTGVEGERQIFNKLTSTFKPRR